MPAYVVGAIIIGLPALALAWATLWNRHRPIFGFAAAMIVIGVGYLVATGAAGDIGRVLLPGIAGARLQPAPAR